ncbi:MAG: polysaccharide deacetylase family protein [Clostridia bacterium]|nr:polysaccharide deacetylase family protein [Clostridia bacterium]
MKISERMVSVFLSLVLLLHFLTIVSVAEVKVYRSVETEKKQIALTFDDGPHPILTERILKILDQYGVTATFFMVGENVINYPDAAKEVILAGHEVGNHTFTHPHIANLNEKAIFDEIGRCEDALEELCEYRPHLLRTPQGALTQSLERCLLDDDYILVLWSLDTRDWDNKSTACIVQTVLNNVKSGDIILMHDFIGHNSKTPDALEKIIPVLLSQGYEFVTVSELLGVG